MGKSTISMAIFNSFLYVYQRVSVIHHIFPINHHSFSLYFQYIPIKTHENQIWKTIFPSFGRAPTKRLRYCAYCAGDVNGFRTRQGHGFGGTWMWKLSGYADYYINYVYIFIYIYHIIYIYKLWPWFILYKMIMILRFKLHLGFDSDE